MPREQTHLRKQIHPAGKPQRGVAHAHKKTPAGKFSPQESSATAQHGQEKGSTRFLESAVAAAVPVNSITVRLSIALYTVIFRTSRGEGSPRRWPFRLGFLSQGARVELRNQRNKIRRETHVDYANR